VLHWAPLIDEHDGTECSVGIRDALAQVIRCQHPWEAVASIDNALFRGLATEFDVYEVFASLPARHRPLQSLVDGRAEAGQETMLRLALQNAGLHVEPQVQIDGVGRVDLVVEGCIVVEADSRLAHDGWELHVRDRDRDIDAARQGYPSLRPAYQRTMNRPGDVVEAVRQLLAADRRYRSVN
jgi:very-short-patch-repair endonuclease